MRVTSQSPCLYETLVTRACLKNHFRNLQAPLCGIFYPHSVAVARYAALIRIKSPTNWDSQLTKSLFQTSSRACLKNHFRNLQAPLCSIFYPHSVAVARYAALIRIKSPTNRESQLTKSLFQTRSSAIIKIDPPDQLLI